jgi:hypothetical protein
VLGCIWKYKHEEIVAVLAKLVLKAKTEDELEEVRVFVFNCIAVKF